ncbi:T6SS effector BTH_I2691 family protein [Larsenimonas rhizosphaerae]|uniref:Toxin VasX N-terminal region domain-containing protein n=1 Tax=Larsenimonas rhizosphaerae TaxID=2944682 RepID=A0AA41ZDV5_9GAMM|nr:T6SS effector BTH_I2691 family protein [Larsenimonas rhizosphaerae]MCM2130775.1 hypothetical protein [Larsenimonas rhizosphaerae]MCX2523479.1 hypothetical protein [Larsenimonas rhizosphaerae]
MSSTPDISAIVGGASSQVATTPSAATGSGGCDDCTMCEKSPGLVILPVRYSAIAESHAHGIHGLTPISQGDPFGEGVLDKSMQRARYILRCMRQGYFYLHFPSGDAEGATWRKYSVTSDSNFIPLPLDAPLPDIEKNQACRRSSDWQMARCVTISTPEDVSEAWLAFSDTNWDESIRNRVAQDPSKRMQFLSPAQCIGGGAGQPHTAPLSELTNWVSEYRSLASRSFNSTVADLDDDQNTATFESVYPFHWRAFEADDLVETAERKSNGRAIVFATHDPRGITVELNAEQIQAVAASLQRHSWRIASWEGIQAIKNTVEITAESVYRNGIAENQSMILNVPETRLREAQRKIDNGTATDADRQTVLEMQELLASTMASNQQQYLSQGTIQAHRKRAWRSTRNDVWFGIFEDNDEYLKMSDEEIAQDFKSQVSTALYNEQETVHTPISEDHAKWLGSISLKNCFEFDYKDDDLDSGTHYVEHFIECLHDAADRAECEKLIQEWVEQPDLDDTSNLLMRSLVWNQVAHVAIVKDLENTVITASNAQTAMDKINSAWAASRKYMFNPEASEEAAKNIFSQLLYQTGAPVAKFLSRQLDSAAMNVYVAASMLATGRLMLQRPLAGTPEQHLNWLTAQMRDRIPRNKRPSANQMRRVARAWLKAGGSEPMIRVPNIILLDDKALRQVADGSGGGRAAQARLLNSSQPIILTAENIRETALPKFQAFVNSDARIAAVGLLFSTVSTLFARDAMQDADVFADEEAAGRYYASGVGLIGGVLNTAETGIQRAVAVNSISTTSQESALARAKWYGRFGRFLGAGAAWGFAYYDAKNAIENAKKGNWIMMILYGVSAGLNAILGIMSIFVKFLSGWAGLIFMIALGVALLIEAVKDSDAQNWLKHCFYGSENRWPSVKISDKELQKVLEN